MDGYFLILLITLILLFTLFSYFEIENKFRHLRWGRNGAIAFILIMCLIPVLQKVLMRYSGNFFLGNEKEEYSLLKHKDLWSSACNYFDKKKLFSEVINAVDCTINGKLSDKHTSKKVYAFGNSYLNQIVPALDVLARNNRDFTFYAYGASGCPIWNGTYLKNDKVCSKIYKDFLGKMNRIAKKGDRILLSTPFNFYFRANLFLKDNGETVPTTDEVLRIFQEDLRKVTSSFRARGIDLYLVSPIPLINIKKPDICYQPWSFIRNDCVSILDFNSNKVIELHQGNLIKADGINYINIYDPIYKAVVNNPKLIRMYHDHDHVHVSSYSRYFIAKILGKSLGVNEPSVLWPNDDIVSMK